MLKRIVLRGLPEGKFEENEQDVIRRQVATWCGVREEELHKPRRLGVRLQNHPGGRLVMLDLEIGTVKAIEARADALVEHGVSIRDWEARPQRDPKVASGQPHRGPRPGGGAWASS